MRIKGLSDINVLGLTILEEASEDRALVTSPEASVMLMFDHILERGLP